MNTPLTYCPFCLGHSLTSSAHALDGEPVIHCWSCDADFKVYSGEIVVWRWYGGDDLPDDFQEDIPF